MESAKRLNRGRENRALGRSLRNVSVGLPMSPGTTGNNWRREWETLRSLAKSPPTTGVSLATRAASMIYRLAVVPTFPFVRVRSPISAPR
jgi:hypothetical protein